MRQVLRLFRVILCLSMVAMTVAACSGIAKPFAREKTWFYASDPKAPPVTIASIDGAPKASVDRLASHIYTESKHRGFDTTVGATSHRAITMTGTVTAAPTNRGTTVIYVWDVTGPGGKQKYRISGEETIPGGDAFADPWAAVDDSAMQRIAVKTADELSLFISQLGFDVRMASVPPPAAMLSDQADSIQTASVTGVNTLEAAPAGVPPTDPLQVATAEPQRNRTVPAEDVSAAPAVKPETKTASVKPSKPQKKADAIAVPMVTGAKGRGNAELATAMRKAMAVAGVPVISKQRRGAITIAGAVKLGPISGGQQMVELSWKVLDASGDVLGTISQKNHVPAGSFDKSWGRTADLAAQAAAGGIFKLLSSVQ